MSPGNTLLRLAYSLVLTCAATALYAQSTPISGVDFADQSGVLFVPAKPLAEQLKLTFQEDKTRVKFNGSLMPGVRTLFDGTKLIPIHDVDALGATVAWDPTTATATLSHSGDTVQVHRGSKTIEINKRVQQLRAFQGGVLVLQTHVSTGRKGHGTPSGSFSACRKERIHFSSLYDDSPMPWAVQVNGNVFIHGFTSVPRRPASHGCIRVPLTGHNPAKYLWHWVDIGTPVFIGNAWSEDAAAKRT